jgi:Fe-S-cluster containining protein
LAEDANPIDGSLLCTQCGLCCHGVLHEWGRLEEAEVEPLAALGLEIERTPDYISFVLPCSKVEGTRCSIYEHRPLTCSGYRCALLQRFSNGEIELEAALPLVEQARRLVAQVQAQLPRAESMRAFRLEWRKFLSGKPTPERSPEGRSRLAGAYLQLAVLHRFLDRHFRLEREHTYMASDVNAGPAEGRTS